MNKGNFLATLKMYLVLRFLGEHSARRTKRGNLTIANQTVLHRDKRDAGDM